MNLLLVFGSERWSVDMLVWLRQYWKLRQNFNFLSPVLQSFWSYFKQGNTDLNMWLQNSFWRLWRVDIGIIIYFFTVFGLKYHGIHFSCFWGVIFERCSQSFLKVGCWYFFGHLWDSVLNAIIDYFYFCLEQPFL